MSVVVFYDAIKEACSTLTGTGDVPLGGAQSASLTFASQIPDQTVIKYRIVDNNGNFENGEGKYNSGANTVTRTTVEQSSNAGALVSFPAGIAKSIVVSVSAKFLNQIPTIQNPNTFAVPVKRISAASYTVLATDQTLRCDPVANAIALTLPNPSTVKGQRFAVKDYTGNASTHNITVTPASGLVDGAASYVISANYGRAVFLADDSGSNYEVMEL